MEKDVPGGAPDMCVPCGEGLINIRVGAVIIKDGKFLMVASDSFDYVYSVGGRVKFGETAEEAVVREVEEETGARLEIDRLGFVLECYFTGDSGPAKGKLVYEPSLYFYMKVPDDFEPVCTSLAIDGSREYLEWIPIGSDRKMVPQFFAEELKHPANTVKHIVSDER